MKRIIAAVSPDGIIGLGGKIPWHYKGDFKRFKELTTGGVVIMGRLTFESMGKRPLPNRHNIVVCSGPIGVEGVNSCENLKQTLAVSDILFPSCNVWFIGGSRIYEEAMAFADEIDLTHVPDKVEKEGAVLFPKVDTDVFAPGPIVQHEYEPTLLRQTYTRVARS